MENNELYMPTGMDGSDESFPTFLDQTHNMLIFPFLSMLHGEPVNHTNMIANLTRQSLATHSHLDQSLQVPKDFAPVVNDALPPSYDASEDLDFVRPEELSGCFEATTGFHTQMNSWVSSENKSSVSSDSNVWPSVRLATYSRISSLSLLYESHEMEISKQDHPSNHNSMSSMLDFDDNKQIQLLQSCEAGSKRYVDMIQEILSEITTCSLKDLEQTSRFDGFFDRNNRFESQIHPDQLKERGVKAIRKHLLVLLQKVDDIFKQCSNEIDRVKSAFHGVTELDPRVHASFALHTFSLSYRNLRKTICNRILELNTKESELSSSLLRKHLAHQQLRGKGQQLWKPQRGLPEKSVCILREWLFRNFLHPYPKDSEKEELAVKSGLTRSKVSNWFINARVRLWKPLIEEMYLEMNTIRTGDGETESSHRNHHHQP